MFSVPIKVLYIYIGVHACCIGVESSVYWAVLNLSRLETLSLIPSPSRLCVFAAAEPDILSA